MNDPCCPEDCCPSGRSYVGCIAGALSFTEFEDGLTAAGFVDISITSTDEPLPGIHSAIIKAARGPSDVLG